jgi:hypothetical protein
MPRPQRREKLTAESKHQGTVKSSLLGGESKGKDFISPEAGRKVTFGMLTSFYAHTHARRMPWAGIGAPGGIPIWAGIP